MLCNSLLFGYVAHTCTYYILGILSMITQVPILLLLFFVHSHFPGKQHHEVPHSIEIGEYSHQDDHNCCKHSNRSLKVAYRYKDKVEEHRCFNDVIVFLLERLCNDVNNKYKCGK